MPCTQLVESFELPCRRSFWLLTWKRKYWPNRGWNRALSTCRLAPGPNFNTVRTSNSGGIDVGSTTIDSNTRRKAANSRSNHRFRSLPALHKRGPFARTETHSRSSINPPALYIQQPSTQDVIITSTNKYTKTSTDTIGHKEHSKRLYWPVAAKNFRTAKRGLVIASLNTPKSSHHCTSSVHRADNSWNCSAPPRTN